MSEPKKGAGPLDHALTWGTLVVGIGVGIFLLATGALTPIGLGACAAAVVYGVARVAQSGKRNGVELHQATILPAAGVGVLVGIAVSFTS